MPASYPLHLDVRGRAVLVVGGGPVAARRAHGLADAGAAVRVVAPWACEEITDDPRLALLRRAWTEADLDDVWLVHTATGDPGTDAAVAAAAEARRLWCVRADAAEASAAWTPGVVRRGDVTVSVTAGGDPRRALRLRGALAAALDSGSLPLRRTRPGAGHVALVGGGPGDPGLITTRGRALLAQADVVVVDRLAPRALLAELDPDVEVVEAGKAPHAHTLSQADIDALLVERARAGLRVVRLKGGDPYVLGRGGEEALACVAAGVTVEVVPGVTSAVAVPAAAGIPITHRGIARAFTVVSLHDAEVDWTSLAALDATLVLLMGVGRLAEAATCLIRAGRRSSTPVAVVEEGTTARQRTTLATLADVAAVAAARGVRSPAVVVVGDVVPLAEALGPSAAATPIVLAAHGSPDPRHAAVVRALVEDLRADGHDASVGWLDHEQPALCLAVSAAGPRAVVVPLLLADGHHARVDVAGAAGTARVAEVLVPDPGTPDERVLRVLHDRLRESGADAARGVVLAAAGSRGVAHAATCDGVAAALAARLGVPVRTAYASVSPSVADAVHGLRAAGVVGPLALAPLILAPGRLSDQVRSQAEAAGVSFLAEPLGRHPALRDLLLARARAAR